MRHHVGLGTLLVGVGFAVAPGGVQSPKAEPPGIPSASEEKTTMVHLRLIGADGKLAGPVLVAKTAWTDEEWRRRLTPGQYRILRAQGTEPAFCGGLLHEKGAGVFVCAGCALPLFDARAKFESGTGWPSFFQPIAPENVVEREDAGHGMVRTEIVCARCDGHLGHVFDDGPPPAGRRFCLNSESLRFVAAADLPQLAQRDAPAAKAVPQAPQRAEAVLAGGCFWCVEGVFEQIDGVIEVVSGYAGGASSTANYAAVCTGDTGHAEAVKIVYDPAKVSFETLLEIHFATHDPTTLDQQGNDHGPQYRSAVFCASEEEKQIAQAFLADLTDAKVFDRPIVTTLEPLKEFYPAEAYHQDYVCRNPDQAYVRSVALPKVKKVREKFKAVLKPEAGPAK